jgi:hypothetical protein
MQASEKWINIPADLAPAHDCLKKLLRCGASSISCGKQPSKKTPVLLWFATLTGFCASKPGERSKWPFLFTA